MILENSIRKITVSEYHKMAEIGIIQPDEKVELINGNIVKMSSKFSLLHSSCRRRLTNILTNLYFDELVIVGVQDTFHFDNLSEPVADIILFKFVEDYYSNNYPKTTDVLLIVEISDSTLDYDKTTKLRLYASANIPEYWVINLVDNCIEVFQNPKDNFYQKHLILTNDDVLNLPFEKTLKVFDVLK